MLGVSLPPHRAPRGTATITAKITATITLAVSAAVTAVIGLGAAAGAKAADIHFGVPAQPGATVKAEVASQLLDTLGYEVARSRLSPAFIMKSIDDGEVDATLDVWLPVQRGQLAPLQEAGSGRIVAENVPDGQIGFTVPDYVWEAGVRSVTDLAEHAERFDAEIYGYEVGTGANEVVLEALARDAAGLGDWQLKQSSTSAMLLAAKRAIQRGDWIVFMGWKPHWINITHEIRYLKDAELIFADSGGRSTVNTVANTDFLADNPNLATFLAGYAFDAAVESAWVYAYGFKERPAEEVAAQWIAENPDWVERWLEGVTTAEGAPAWPVVRRELIRPDTQAAE